MKHLLWAATAAGWLCLAYGLRAYRRWIADPGWPAPIGGTR